MLICSGIGSASPRSGDGGLEKVLHAQLALRDGGEGAVGERQGIAVAVVEIHHLAEIEGVVAAVVLRPWLALEVGEDSGQPRRRLAFHPSGLRPRAAGEVQGELPLFGAQDVYG